MINGLEYNVLLPDINNEDGYVFNVFRSARFQSCLMNLKATYEKNNELDLHEEIRRCVAYCFWAKAEYEIEVKCLFGKKEHKIDVYEQIMLNFELFFKYLILNWSEIPSKTYRQQRRSDE